MNRGHKLRPREKKIFAANHNSIALENEVADGMNTFRYITQEQVDEDVLLGKLVPLRSVSIDRRLPTNRRYALPATVDFLERFSNEFAGQFNQPLMVDSAVRPATVQKRLLRWNRSAASAYGERASTHERGTTIDLSKHLTKPQYRWLVWRLLYYRAISRVLVIEERGCFHIFVTGESYGDR